MDKPAPLEQAEVIAAKLAPSIHNAMPEGWGFALVMYTLNTEGNGRETYISDLDRDDLVQALRNTADKIENREREV